MHITQVQKKLKIAFATIKRILEYIPSTNHKSIYHTLFESQLSYCVSVWGGAKKKSKYKIFTLQKRAIRFLLGDYDSFIDKFCTSARTRPFGHQFLGENFYCKEHTKPIFTKHNLLTIGNLYKYTALNIINTIQIQIQILGQSRRLVGPRPILALPIYHSFVPGLTVACSEG